MRTCAAALAVVALVGCHSSKSQPAPSDAQKPTAAVVVPPMPVAPARFSRPIAAVRSPGGVTLVAGLVAPRSVIAVTALSRDGATRWTRDVISGVSWSPNATLSVLRAPGGSVVVWRGPRSGQEVTVARAIDLEGVAPEEPFAVGAAVCATEAELAWMDRAPKGSWVVMTRAFGSPAPSLALTLPEDRDPALLCGVRRVFALADGEDDVLLSTWGAGARTTPLRAMAGSDLRGEDERGHEVYAVGDALGVVRIGASGGIASREISGDQPSPWRRLRRKLTDGDDVTLVDADARLALLVFTRDATAAGGDGTGASSVEAIVWERSGSHDAAYQLAAPDPAAVRGPFWSGAVSGGIVVGWAERSTKVDASGAPIVGMSYRLVSSDGVGELRRIERASDELVDADCDGARCYAVALRRASGEDGTQPEVSEVLAYP